MRASAWSSPFLESPPPPPESNSTSLPSIQTIPPSPIPSPEDNNQPLPPTTSRPGYSPTYISGLPSSTNPLASPPLDSPADPAPHSTAISGTTNPYLVYLGHLQKLIPIQRSLLLLNLQKAHHYYQYQKQLRTLALQNQEEEKEEEGKGEIEELREVEDLLKECGLWKRVVEHVEEVEAEYIAKEPEEEEKKDEFKVVQVKYVKLFSRSELKFFADRSSFEYSGLPYLLHTPPALLTSPSRPSLPKVKSLARANSILKILTTMLQLLITFQPSSPAIAHGRALLRPSSSNPLGGGISPELALNAGGRPGHFHAAGPGAGGGPVRRRATISITLHLDSLLQLMLPLFFLSLKLAFLLFIFARHASPTKRTALIVMAVGWVLWEGVAINRRRRIAAANAGGGGGGAAAGVANGAGGNRDRDRERDRDRDRERRRMARYLADQERANQQAVDQAANPVRQAGAPQDQAAVPAPPAAGAQPPRLRRATPRPPSAGNRGANTPTRREPHSVLSPKYWINSLAAVGLVAEARELGLSPRYIAGRPIAPVGPQRTNLTRWERKQVELRKLARMVGTGFVLFFATLVPEIERKRKKALEKRERLLAEKKVRWEKERADREERHRLAEQTTRNSGAGEPVASGSGSETRKRIMGRGGRNAVSDQELFKDGGSEASGIDVPPPIPSTSTSSQPAATTSQAVPLTSTSNAALPDSTNSPPQQDTTINPATPALPESTALDSDTENDLDEGDGDIAASASVSDNSDDEDAAGARRPGQDARGNGEGGGAGEGEGEAAVVAIF